MYDSVIPPKFWWNLLIRIRSDISPNKERNAISPRRRRAERVEDISSAQREFDVQATRRAPTQLASLRALGALGPAAISFCAILARQRRNVAGLVRSWVVLASHYCFVGGLTRVVV